MSSVYRKLLGVLTIAAVSLTLVSCAKSFKESSPIGEETSDQKSTFDRDRHRERFRKQLSKLRQNSKGVGKADFLGLPGPCDLLGRILKTDSGDYRSPKIGMNIGIEAAAEAMVMNANAGFEITTDLYHNQITVSSYVGGSGYGRVQVPSGRLASTPGIEPPEAGIRGHWGLVFGLDKGVAQYKGTQ
jgi:hypothetical protein